MKASCVWTLSSSLTLVASAWVNFLHNRMNYWCTCSHGNIYVRELWYKPRWKALTVTIWLWTLKWEQTNMGVRRRSVRRNSSVSSEELLVSVLKESQEEPKIRFAKKKKPDSKLVIALQVACVILALLATTYVYYCFEHFHWHITWFYAHHVDDHHAQHKMGHLLLKDGKNTSAAFEYFRRSASQGHPESAYNLAAGHLSGYKTDVQKGGWSRWNRCG